MNEDLKISGRPHIESTAPLVCFVGKKNSGKTTFVEKLVSLLAGSGLAVAYIKHDVHGFSIDHPGTDTQRLSQAGACMVIISSPAQIACLENVEDERSLTELCRVVKGPIDLIVAEGFKSAAADRIEVCRAGASMVCPEKDLLAAISERPGVARSIPVFNPEAVSRVARLLIKRYNLKPSPLQK